MLNSDDHGVGRRGFVKASGNDFHDDTENKRGRKDMKMSGLI